MDSSPWPGPLALVGKLASSAPIIRGFTGGDWGLLIGLLAMLVIAALASASETALNSVSRITIRRQSEGGDSRAQLIARLIHDPNTYLTTILILNSVAVIIASTLATLLALDVFPSYGEVISTVIVALVVLIFCEVAPKTAAIQNPDRWARFVALPIFYTYTCLRPIIAGLTWLTSGIVRVLGGRTVRHGPFVTEEDLRMLVDVGEEEGVLEEDEKDILHAVFGFSDKTVREIMVPRIDMVTIEADEPIDDGVGLILQGGQSRIPVYSKSIDNIIGVLYAKDLLRALATGNPPESVRSLVRPAYFVPETKHLDDLLHELQQVRVHMAIVNDEYGQVAGLVTIEDLVEEILGDIQDEYDREETVYEQIGPDEYLVDAKIGIDDFNELMDITLQSDDYDTLGGFVYSHLDKIPSVGDVVHDGDLTYTVLGTRGRRVTKVKVVRGEVDTVEPDVVHSGDSETSSALAVPAAHEPARLVSPQTEVPALPPPGDTVPGETAEAPADPPPLADSPSSAIAQPETPTVDGTSERNGRDPHSPTSEGISGGMPDMPDRSTLALAEDTTLPPNTPPLQRRQRSPERRHPYGRNASRLRHR